jgi:outer membrane receptor protein involved in Fe transport
MDVTPHLAACSRAVIGALLLFTTVISAHAADAARRNFDVPAGAASNTLKQFSAQAGGHLLYSADAVAGVTTNAVKGEFAPHVALDQMLDGTRLVGRRDTATGALSVTTRSAATATGQLSPNVTAHEGNGSDPSGASKGVVELSPFTVNSDRDRGFVAASALAGGRLSTDLRDTPVAYSVLTRDFIEALNITNLSMAQQWTTGFNEIEDDGRQNQFGDGERGRRTFRGVSSNQQQIEFFPAYYDYDSYNLERFDFARGPNSILFGSGSMGGTANGLFKRAQTGKTIREAIVSVSSWESYRTALDLNQPLSSKLAVRFNGLWEETHTWRDTEYYDRRAATITATYRPWRGGNFRVTAEKGDNHRNASLSGMGDRVSGWDGTTTFSGRLTATPANANAAGISVFGVNNFIWSPGIMNGGIVDWNGHAFTLGGNANAAVPVGGRLVVGPLANIDAQPLLGVLNVPDFRFDNAFRGAPKFSIPPREKSTSLGGDSWATQYDNIHAGYEQQVGKHIFLSASANYSYSKVLTHFTVARGLNNLYIDLNRLLPTGESNPNFLNPYSESTQDFDHVTRRSKNARGNAAFVFDDTRFGSFRLNLESGISDANFSRIKLRMMVKDPNVASRDWINQIARLRVYWDGPTDQIIPGNYNVVIPATGATRSLPLDYVIDVGRPNDTTSIDDEFIYQQAALGAKLFKNRLNLLAAFRRDDFESITNNMLLRGDQPNGWDGNKVLFRPRPPEDYFTLTYVPKNANGTPTGAPAEALARPRTANVPQPQYANDRFRDDYSLPTLSGVVNTYSAGGTIHVTKWASVFGNFAETWLPPAGELRINGERFLPSASEGWDAGVRFSLLGDRVSLSASKYASKQDNIGRGTGTNGGLANALGNLFNSIANTNVLGDLTAGGMNQRGMLTVPGNYYDTASRKSKGYEFELTANVTPQWRISANYAIQSANEVDAYADTRAYIAANDPLFRQILGDAGVDVVNGQAVLRAGTSGQNSPDSGGVISSYNQMHEIARNLTAAEQKVARLVDGTGNFFTDYTINQGALKNVRLGLGLNYRGKEVIGYRGGDSIRTGPTTAVDDPSVDATNPVYRKAYSLWTGVVGYTFRPTQKLRVKLDFRVSNLLNEDMLLYYTTTQRPPGGDISNPARVATPSQFSFVTPRNYTLTATFNF